MPNEVLVTGCNRGIGLELARQLAGRGDRVIATCREPERAEELRSLEVEVHRLDVTDGAAVARLAADLGERPLDLLINNAGIGVSGRPSGDIDYEEFLLFVDTNTVGPLRVVDALLPHLRRGRRRVIANMTSRMGSIEDNSSGGSYPYRASKAALNMVTRNLAIDLAPEGFTCVVLHPGWVATDMGGSSAPTTPAESVRGLLSVLDGLTPGDSGTFIDYTGKRLPW